MLRDDALIPWNSGGFIGNTVTPVASASRKMPSSTCRNIFKQLFLGTIVCVMAPEIHQGWARISLSYVNNSF